MWYGHDHPLFDNKRLSLILTFTFLEINGRRVTLSEDAAFDLVLSVAQSRLDLPEVAAILTANTEEVPA